MKGFIRYCDEERVSVKKYESLDPGMYISMSNPSDLCLVKKDEPGTVYNLDGEGFVNGTREFHKGTFRKMNEKEIKGRLESIMREGLLLIGRVPPFIPFHPEKPDVLEG